MPNSLRGEVKTEGSNKSLGRAFVPRAQRGNARLVLSGGPESNARDDRYHLTDEHLTGIVR